MLRTSAPVQFQSESNGQKLHWNSFRFCWDSIVFSWWFLISSGFRDLWTGCRCTVLSSDMLKASIFFPLFNEWCASKLFWLPMYTVIFKLNKVCYSQERQSFIIYCLGPSIDCVSAFLPSSMSWLWNSMIEHSPPLSWVKAGQHEELTRKTSSLW